MKRSLSSAAPDFLEKIGRKGFPAGLVCLVVEGDGPTREKITEQMGQLSYNGESSLLLTAEPARNIALEGSSWGASLGMVEWRWAAIGGPTWEA